MTSQYWLDKQTTDTLESDFEQVCQLAAPQVTQLWYRKVGNTSPEVDATLYHQLVGSLLYLIDSSPNLSFVVGRVSHYMQTPHESH